MPTYEYECKKCGRVFEIRQRISEAPLTTHEGCGGSVMRLLSPAPFILKGEGWYVTDYPSEARKKAKEAEKGATDAKKAASDGAPASDAKPAPDGGKAGDSAAKAPSSTSPSAPASTSTSTSG